MNGLARAIFFGKQGELRERTVENQLQRASALNIIINAINIQSTLNILKLSNTAFSFVIIIIFDIFSLGLAFISFFK